MERALFDLHAQTISVPEPVSAGAELPDGLTGREQDFYKHLLDLPRGRIEQEFLPSDTVSYALSRWDQMS